jgi:hypothetical protein
MKALLNWVKNRGTPRVCYRFLGYVPILGASEPVKRTCCLRVGDTVYLVKKLNPCGTANCYIVRDEAGWEDIVLESEIELIKAK